MFLFALHLAGMFSHIREGDVLRFFYPQNPKDDAVVVVNKMTR